MDVVTSVRILISAQIVFLYEGLNSNELKQIFLDEEWRRGAVRIERDAVRLCFGTGKRPHCRLELWIDTLVQDEGRSTSLDRRGPPRRGSGSIGRIWRPDVPPCNPGQVAEIPHDVYSKCSLPTSMRWHLLILLIFKCLTVFLLKVQKIICWEFHVSSYLTIFYSHHSIPYWK